MQLKVLLFKGNIYEKLPFLHWTALTTLFPSHILFYLKIKYSLIFLMQHEIPEKKVKTREKKLEHKMLIFAQKRKLPFDV